MACELPVVDAKLLYTVYF